MQTALIGIVGVLLGILLNEAVRRQRRIEDFAFRVFDKRLKIYEELYDVISKAAEVAHVVIEEDGHSKEDRHALISAAIHDVAGFCDRNAMYLNEELTIHCISTFISTEDIYEMKSGAKKKGALEHYRDNLVAAKSMIRKEAGVADIEKHFSSITQARHSSPVIEYFREEKKKRPFPQRWAVVKLSS